MDSTLQNKILDEKIRPLLARHQGDIEIVGFKDGIVTVRLIGQCHGCPAASLTMEEVVKKELMEALPEVKDVVLDNSVSDELLNFAKQILRK